MTFRLGRFPTSKLKLKIFFCKGKSAIWGATCFLIRPSLFIGTLEFQREKFDDEPGFVRIVNGRSFRQPSEMGYLPGKRADQKLDSLLTSQSQVSIQEQGLLEIGPRIRL